MSLEHEIYDQLKSIGLRLEDVENKLDMLLAKGSTKGFKTVIRDPETKETFTKEEDLPLTIEKTIIKGGRTIPAKGSGRYEWFKVKDLPGVKVRKCSNEGCLMFLKWNGDKKKYEHWKYDANTGEGGYVQDNCDYYVPEGL